MMDACFVLQTVLLVLMTGKEGSGQNMTVTDLEKQRVLTEFFTAELEKPDRIHRRLETVFGERTADLAHVKSWARFPNETTDSMEAGYKTRVYQRVIIQFLVLENNSRITPMNMHKRLARIFPETFHLGSVYRWANRFKGGQVHIQHVKEPSQPAMKHSMKGVVSTRNI